MQGVKYMDLLSQEEYYNLNGLKINRYFILTGNSITRRARKMLVLPL